MKGIDPKYVMYLGLLVTIEQAIGHGTVSLTNLVPADWSPYITSWCNFLAFIGTSIMTYQAAVSSPLPGPLVNTPISPVAKAIIMLAMLVATQALLMGDAHAAQLKKPAVTGDPLKDIKTDLGIPNDVGVTKNPDGSIKCDFNIFLILSPKNLESIVKACVTSADSTLVQDTQIALTSAQQFTQPQGGAPGDAMAVQCLQPGLAILTAAIPKPAIEAAAAQPATATTPAVPAVAAVPAYNPGLITLFQKLREFGLAGGPSACQNWVNSTVQSIAAPAAGAVVGAAGAAVVGGGL